MGTPHKHAALIKAWADGVEIQALVRGDGGCKWMDVNTPIWRERDEFRVKPSNVVRYCPVFTMPAGSVFLGMGVTDRHHATSLDHSDRGAFDRLHGVLRIELNPDTFELESATMEAP